jgi:hypothetical protein
MSIQSRRPIFQRPPQLHRPIASLSCFEKSAYYAGIKIFNSLPSNLTSLVNKKAQFKVTLKRYLITSITNTFVSGDIKYIKMLKL